MSEAASMQPSGAEGSELPNPTPSLPKRRRGDTRREGPWYGGPDACGNASHLTIEAVLEKVLSILINPCI